MEDQNQRNLIRYERLIGIENQQLNIRKSITKQGKEIVWETVKEFVIKEIPVFGKAFSVAENINNKKQVENLINGLEYIWNNFNILNNQLKDKLDKDFANENNQEFILLIQRVLENITKQYKNEKIKYLANFIANVSTKENSNTFHKEGILEKISNYSIEHISVLKYFYDESFRDGDINEMERKQLANSKININSLKIDGIKKSVQEICFRDLEADGFIDEITGAMRSYGGGNYYITDYGKRCIELLKDF